MNILFAFQYENIKIVKQKETLINITNNNNKNKNKKK